MFGGHGEGGGPGDRGAAAFAYTGAVWRRGHRWATQYQLWACQKFQAAAGLP